MSASAMRGVRLCSVVAVLALTMSACAGSSESSALAAATASPTTTATVVTDTFEGKLAQFGSEVHPFTVTTTGSLVAGYTAIGPLSTMSMGMGIGTWDGTTCSDNLAKNDDSRMGYAALSGTAQAGNYCIRVYDSGNMIENMTVTYTVQVIHY